MTGWDGNCASYRASAEATVISETPAALAPHHAARRATREKALSRIGTSALDAALPPRHTLAASQHRPKAGTQAASVAAVELASPHSARGSLLNRQTPLGDVQQQQQQAVASPSGVVMDLQPPSQRLAVIPEAAEECTAQEVPQDVQQDNAAGHASAKQDSAALYPAAPTDAVSAPASTGFQEAAAARQPTSAEQVESLHMTASPRPTLRPREQVRTLGKLPSKAERQQRGSYHSQPAAAHAAEREGASAAAAPQSLLQLAAAPAAQHQPPSQGFATPHDHQYAAQSAEHHHRSAAQPAAPSESSAAGNARQDASSSGADVLQGLQASLLQTVTSAVESAMTQMRWVPCQRVRTQIQKLLSTLLLSRSSKPITGMLMS